MCDFDLAQALESSAESGENAFESGTCIFMGREECTLCDTKHKNLVRSDENQCELLATTLKGGSFCQRVKFKLTRYRPAPPPNHRKRLVVFTIVSNSNNTLLSCSWQEEEEEPVLKLEACSEQEEKALTAEADMERSKHFLFYMKTTGKVLTTFESVKYPGWFISTSQEEGQPVQMCQENTTRREIYFKVNL